MTLIRNLNVSYQSTGLLAGLDVSTILQRAEHPAYKPVLDLIIANWHSVQTRLDAKGEEGYYSYGALAWHSITPGLIDAGMVYRLTQNRDALKFVELGIARVHHVWKNPGSLKKLPAGKMPVQSYDELALAADLCSDALSDQATAQLHELMREKIISDHADEKVIRYYGGGGNVPLAQTLNAAAAALVWGEKVNHPTWRNTVDFAIESIRCYLRGGIDSHGLGYEWIGYSHHVYHHIYLTAQLLYQRNYIDLFKCESQLAQIPLGSLTCLLPGGSGLINIGDHGRLSPWTQPWLLLTAKHYQRELDLAFWNTFEGPNHPKRPFGDDRAWFDDKDEYTHAQFHGIPSAVFAFLWWDANEKPKPLASFDLPTSSYAKGTEIVNLRSSWSDDAVYVNFLGSGRSHASQTHAHTDAGHFSIFAYGEHLAVDTGRYNVDEDQHSTVLINGIVRYPNDAGGWRAQPRAGRVSDYQSQPWFDYACVDASKQKDCYWADRHLFFMRIDDEQAYAITIDNINPNNDANTYLWQLQTDHPNTIAIENNRACIAGENARLNVHLTCPLADDFPQQPHTLQLSQDEKYWQMGKDWNAGSTHWKMNTAISSVKRPRLLAEHSGLNGQIMAVMIPRQKNHPDLNVTMDHTTRVMCVHVDHPLGRDSLYAGLDHGYINRPDIRVLSQLAIVRRDTQANITHQWSLSNEPIEVRN